MAESHFCAVSFHNAVFIGRMNPENDRIWRGGRFRVVGIAGGNQLAFHLLVESFNPQKKIPKKTGCSDNELWQGET